MPREGKTCSKVDMSFPCMCVVIIEVMFAEQPFYIIVTDEQNKVCTYVRVVLEKSSHKALEYLICICRCMCGMLHSRHTLEYITYIHNSKHISTCGLWHTLLLCKAT